MSSSFDGNTYYANQAAVYHHPILAGFLTTFCLSYVAFIYIAHWYLNYRGATSVELDDPNFGIKKTKHD